jgi:hypothetical protein
MVTTYGVDSGSQGSGSGSSSSSSSMVLYGAIEGVSIFAVVIIALIALFVHRNSEKYNRGTIFNVMSKTENETEKKKGFNMYILQEHGLEVPTTESDRTDGLWENQKSAEDEMYGSIEDSVSHGGGLAKQPSMNSQSSFWINPMLLLDGATTEESTADSGMILDDSSAGGFSSTASAAARRQSIITSLASANMLTDRALQPMNSMIEDPDTEFMC